MSEAIKKLKRYEKEGYIYAQVEVEECHYSDSDSKESGERLVIHIVMDKPLRKATLTKAEFESLIDKACDSRTPKPDSKGVETSESNQTDDCNENHIHPDNLVGT